MKKYILATLLSCAAILANAQKIIIPGSADVNKYPFNLAENKYTIYYVKDNDWKPKGSYNKQFKISGNQLISTINYTDENNEWYRTRISIADAKTFAPISFFSKSTKYTFDEKLGKDPIIKIHTMDNSEKDEIVKLDIKEPYFEYEMLEALLTTLPLTTGYKATLPLYYFDKKTKTPVTKYDITDVKSYVHKSPKTGKHDAWLVSVLEQFSNSTYYYVVDKKDHRLWQREMFVRDGTWEICVNEEVDYQPIKNKFNKTEALTKVKNGNSVILGVAFARDHVKGNIPAIFNLNKAQYAPKGTKVSILLNSPYIEEWKEVNKKIRKGKKLPEVPIDPNVSACISTTEVYDDKGHFEFTNLVPGEYILMTSFDYTHNYSYSYQSGTSYLMHPSGAVLRSNPVYSIGSGWTGANANIEKKVTIEKDGEKIEVKLKDTM